MDLKKPSVLLAGESISCDRQLKIRLIEHCKVIAVNKLSLAEKVPEWESVDLAALELSSGSDPELNVIKFLKRHQPLILIVVIDSDRKTEAVVRAFQFGAKDFFRKPYDPVLLGDRIEGLLRKKFAAVAN
ncbi:hypothetical protein GWO43_17100 [candidate division KSB1 bacterium]|nr:hypothetical protein [candidate division KSB1 bacterium]NIT72559.1 hypothetical protein [candidate division KSB1 bacterium]NIX72239.1 hypothetical protein [candidate division KSB1 bacterium]